jgi:hypothetical protein
MSNEELVGRIAALEVIAMTALGLQPTLETTLTTRSRCLPTCGML